MLIMALAIMSVYWKDSRIHTLGNFGKYGSLHASIAPLFTHAINTFVYGSRNVRKELHDIIDKYDHTVDFGCGTGISTPCKKDAIGIDVSNEMLTVARKINKQPTFIQGNAEWWGEKDMTDAVTISFLFHEVPPKGRNRIIENAMRIARKEVFVIDIAPEYKPSRIMLRGEPFITEYLESINSEMEKNNFIRNDMITGHVRMWSYKL